MTDPTCSQSITSRRDHSPSASSEGSFNSTVDHIDLDSDLEDFEVLFSDSHPRALSPKPSPNMANQQPVLKPGDCKPQSFHGGPDQDADAFIMNFKDYIDLHQLTTDADILGRFKLSLTGAPRAWLKQKNPQTWRECEASFLGKYLGLDTRCLLYTSPSPRDS